ncbi:MAG: class I SAM-dependent methyltransferase [Verrucomicrobiota bacterium]
MTEQTPLAKPVTLCLSCGSDALAHVLDLGIQPLANNLLSEADLHKKEPKFPLGLQVCTHCWLMQLSHLVPPTDLFSDYLYFSSFSDAMLEHARLATEQFREQLQLNEKSLVVEIASNDGYLLKNFVTAGIPCLGIEPAANIAKVARQAGVETIERFFGEECADEVSCNHGKADLILGNNVFAHVPDTNDFVAGLEKLLKPEGRIILEFPYAIDFIDHSEFDTIYHEHVFYFSLTALTPLFERHGLTIVKIERLPLHGGSLRLFAAKQTSNPPVDASVESLLQMEKKCGIKSIAYYHSFAKKAHEVKSHLIKLLSKLHAKGKTIAAYGASAKGSTLLNFCDIDPKQIDYIVDRSTYKQGSFSPGLHLPIHSTERLAASQPDYTLLLTWNFSDEIISQQKSYLDAGGHFIRPIPNPEIL